ncbi:TON1 Recruiting Motif 8 [Hibiscus trionum]|nr:TON1 Recruiting Motif 8 [Hibiscus trionum]
MEVEKKHSRGGFFHLFDWNGKSRKKLFLNNAEISGESKRGKPVESPLKSLPYSMDGDDYNGTSSNTRSADFSSASSVTSDEGCGSRAPGVVARLMGLDSLPTPNVSELSSTTYSGSCSLRVSHYERSIPNLWNEHQPMDYTDISNKLDRSSSNPIEPRFHKVQNRPIERFQTEILPPKSAKPIPITHHKLLSPVKRPGFIPTKNAAYIMEAAAKIIDVSPPTTSEHKVPSLGSSSVPLKIRDLKEKIEAAHKLSRPQRSDQPSQSVAKSLKEQHKGKSHNKSDSTPAFGTTRNSEKGSSNSSRNKGKLVSLAEQARVNVRRKEGSFSSGNESPANPKEGNDAKGKHFSRRQADMRKNVENGTSANRTNNVLRHNNQKQNCISNRDYSTSKTSTLDQQGRKARSVNGTVGLNRTNKVTVNSESQSRNMSSSATGPSKEPPMSRRKSLSRNKQPANEGLQSGKVVSENSPMNGGERSIKCNVTTTDGDSNQDAEKMKTSMDVVSFTFTSPIKRSLPDVPSRNQVEEMSCSFDGDPSGDSDLLFSKSSGFSSLGLSMIGGDAQSFILGKKLHELTYRVESSNCNIILEETPCSPAYSRKTSVLPSGTLTTTSMGHLERLPVDLEKDISHSSANFNCSSINNPELDWRRKWQLSEEIEDQNASNSSSETGIDLDLQHPSPISTLELLVTSECFADSRDDTTGMMCLARNAEVLSSSPRNESSQTVGETDEKLQTTTSNSTDFKESTNSELDFVKMVLQDSELKFIEYALGQTDNIMTLNAFDQLGTGTEGHGEDHDKLELQLLLDCVSESLELRYGQVFVGSCKGWEKWGELIQNKGWLAEELYKEILGWRNMGNLLEVDDLVGKNMNTKHERWLDFNMEAFEEGLEVEKTILTCLVDELVFDLLL